MEEQTAQSILWVDKYAPKTLDDYVLNEGQKSYFKNMIASHQLQSFSLIASPGSGKTSLARVIANESKADVLFVKCATEGTIDVLRSKVEPFCNAMSFDGRTKLVILDEIDSASSSGESNFQKGLRTLIEAAQSDTRFILTANYDIKEKALLSRCPLIQLSFDKKDLLLHVKKILDTEKIKYTKESLKQFVLTTFAFYPDVRRIVGYLQLCCNSGILTVKDNAVVNSEKAELVQEIVKKTIESSNVLEARKLYLQSKGKISDYLETGSQLFNYVADNGLVDDEGLLKLVDLLYQLNIVIDKEPTYFGMLIAIKKHLKNEAQ